MPKLSERTFSAIELNKTSLRDWAGIRAVVAGGSIVTGAKVAASAAVISLSAAIGVPVIIAGAVVTGVGLSLLGPTAWRVIRPRRRADYLHCENLHEEDLNYKFWDCHMFNIGVVGPSGTGKTTVKQLLRGLSTSQITSTNGTEYHLLELDPLSDKFGALIDGRGTPGGLDGETNLVGGFSVQTDVARQSHILIVVFDHFDTRTRSRFNEVKCDPKRLEFHELFIKTVLDSLSKVRPNNRHPNNLRRVIFLVSKKDLWMEGPDGLKVETWIKSLISDIIKHHASELPDPLPFRPFSKDDPKDLAWLLDQLREATTC
jgi:hypothetical protein